MSKVCSLYKSPVGWLTIVNDGYYITNILHGNHTCDFPYDPKDTINSKVIVELEEYFDGKRKNFDIPINYVGTSFQKKVWNALTKIPYGETRSYSDIAESIGKPNSIRAIGTANAKNPIAIVIPAHRVINSNGTLSGYNGGVYIKKKLIDFEKSNMTAINQRLLSDNRTSNELLRIALSSIEFYEFYYYPKESVEVFPIKTAEHYGLEVKYENAPYSFFEKCVYPKDETPYFDMFNKILNGEQTATAVYRNKNGTKWYRVMLSVAEHDDDNNPITVVGISEDITEEKNSEFERNSLLDIHKEIFSSINDMFIGVHRLDLTNGTIRSFKIISNFDGLELNKDYDFNYWLECLSKNYHSSDIKRLCYQFSLSNIIKHRDLGEHNLQETYRRLNGSTYSWISNSIIMNNDNFSNDIAIIVQIDVSDNYQKSNIIHALGNEYYCLYYLNLDEDTYEILRYEDIVKNKLNMAPEGSYSEIMKSYIDNFVHPDDVESMIKFSSINNLRSSLGSQQNQISHTFRKRIGNHYEWIEIKYILSISQDSRFVTLAMKNVDESIRSELNCKQLLQYALNKAENNNKLKNDFLSKISYNVRKPIVAISGLASLSKANIENIEYVSDSLDKISQSCQELLSLMNEIFDINQIETGDFILNQEEFSLSELFQSTIELICKRATEKNINFLCSVESVLYDRILGDKTRLQQLLSNVLNNAIRYNNFGGRIALTVKQLNILPDNTIPYRIIVQDNGFGISSDELKTIFEPFVRSKDLRVQKINGSGIGLTIAYNIAKLMDGEISVESTLNEGSTFTISLNLSTTEDVSKKPKAFPNLKVLVVNSNEFELNSSCNVLRSMSMNVTPMYFGNDVVNEILSQHQNMDDYFAIIIDTNISDIDYLTLIKNIRKCMGKKPLKILISSYAYACVSIEEKMSDFNIDGIIHKPWFSYQISELFTSLTDNLYYDNPFDTKPLTNTQCLLVDNDLLSRQIDMNILQMLGSKVDTSFYILEEITKNVSSTHYDYIMLDLDATLDYNSIISSIHAIDNKVPIIAMIPYCSQNDFERLLNIGVNSHILKPINNNINSLLSTIISNILQ